MKKLSGQSVKQHCQQREHANKVILCAVVPWYGLVFVLESYAWASQSPVHCSNRRLCVLLAAQSYRLCRATDECTSLGTHGPKLHPGVKVLLCPRLTNPKMEL